ncbi:MAG: hypothetical protein IK134_13430 [Oscillospiraceae bacterium]|nr:hypothetical protein [Oscillospiraceae bacterium]MBR5364309.1 hypothetical protein [Oscillospiraceae bacterium]
MEQLTGDVILEQMRRDYGRGAFGRMILLLLPAVGMGVSAYLHGIKDPVTIILAVATAAALIFFLLGLYRVIFIQKHPLIQQFGSAIALAGCIRAGDTFAIWHTPPYRKHQLIITEEYIVTPEKVQSYLPLEKITHVQRVMLHGAGFLRILFGTRSLAAATALGISAKERRFQKEHPLPDTEQFDLLCLWDVKKHKHTYYVSAGDFHDVLAFLREYLPEAQIKPERSI